MSFTAFSQQPVVDRDIRMFQSSRFNVKPENLQILSKRISNMCTITVSYLSLVYGLIGRTNGEHLDQSTFEGDIWSRSALFVIPSVRFRHANRYTCSQMILLWCSQNSIIFTHTQKKSRKLCLESLPMGANSFL